MSVDSTVLVLGLRAIVGVLIPPKSLSPGGVCTVMGDIDDSNSSFRKPRQNLKESLT